MLAHSLPSWGLSSGALRSSICPISKYLPPGDSFAFNQGLFLGVLMKRAERKRKERWHWCGLKQSILSWSGLWLPCNPPGLVVPDLGCPPQGHWQCLWTFLIAVTRGSGARSTRWVEARGADATMRRRVATTRCPVCEKPAAAQRPMLSLLPAIYKP